MHILMLLQTSFPPDIRVENEILSLEKCGYDVHLLCRNSGDDSFKESWSHSSIHRLIKPGKHKLCRSMLQIPAFINPIWLLRSVFLIKKYDIKIVHVHDLPLTPVALYLKYFYHVKIIYDMHENYPAALQAWKKTGLEYWLKHPGLFKGIERFIIPRFDRLIAVVEENRQRVIEEYEISDDRIVVVSNYVNLETFVADTPYDKIQLPERVKIFLYTGGLDIHRGIDVTLQAFKKLSLNHADILLLVVGGGRSAAGRKTELELRSSIQTDELLKDKVIITGWIDIKYIPWLINKCHYCLLPQAANGHTNTTVPHKIFQYMSFGKPVIAADALPVKRFIAESGGGITFKSGDSENYHAMLEKILSMDYSELSHKAFLKTRESYTWNSAEKQLFSLYESLFVVEDPNISAEMPRKI